MIDPRPLWDFDDPAASAERFLDAAEAAEEPDVRRRGVPDRDDRVLGSHTRWAAGGGSTAKLGEVAAR